MNVRIVNISIIFLGLLSLISCINQTELLSERQDYTIELPTITSIVLDFPATVNVRQGSTQAIKIHAQKEIFDALSKTVTGGEWRIDLGNGSYGYESVTIDITIEHLDKLQTSSTGDIYCKNKFNKLGEIALTTSSTGDIYFVGEAQSIDIEMESTGAIYLEGHTNKLVSTIGGTGDLFGYDLIAKEATIITNSLGDAEVQVQRLLQAIINSSGDIYYKGQPVIEETITGRGDLVNDN